MSEPAPRQFFFKGLAVRFAGRRPNGRVLVEYLQPKTLQPMASWTEAWPHELRSLGLGIADIKSRIAALALVRFVHDDDREPVEARERAAEERPSAQPADYWFNKI